MRKTKMKNILYLSCHAILEYDECKLFSELGYDVRSIGSYTNPHSPADPKRPAIESMKVDLQHIDISNRFHQDSLHQEHLDWADVIICMHMADWVLDQTTKLQLCGKPIIWRSIGQSSPSVEMQIREMKFRFGDQIKIVRYSPNERAIDQLNPYIEDALIRFYKDETELKHLWPKYYRNHELLFVTQSASKRGNHCHFDELEKHTDFISKRLLLGPNNEELTSATLDTRCPEYNELIEEYYSSKLFLYTSTVPASYTLAFMEALMCGTPILTISKDWFRKGHEQWLERDVFEVPDLLPNQILTENSEEIHTRICDLLDDNIELARLSEVSREVGLQHFSKPRAQKAWTELLESL